MHYRVSNSPICKAFSSSLLVKFFQGLFLSNRGKKAINEAESDILICFRFFVLFRRFQSRNSSKNWGGVFRPATICPTIFYPTTFCPIILCLNIICPTILCPTTDNTLLDSTLSSYVCTVCPTMYSLYDYSLYDYSLYDYS
jgi:hypothetical protein